MKGKTQLLPDAGPEVVVQVGATVVVVVVEVVVVVVDVVPVVVPHMLVVQTSWLVELQTQVLQSTVERSPGLQVLGGPAVVVVVVVVVVALDSV